MTVTKAFMPNIGYEFIINKRSMKNRGHMRSVHGWKGVEAILKNAAKKKFVRSLINNTAMVSMELKLHMIVTSKLRNTK